MASRVLYGLSRQGGLPAVFGRVSAATRTPLIATAFTTACVLVLALALPLHHLADVTARLTLVVFTLVNLSLVRLKAREPTTASRVFVAPSWVPWAGAAACVGLLALDLATMLAR